jgi:hypothetical protein
MLLADVFITTKGRSEQFRLSLESFFKNTDPNTYRLTIVDDTGPAPHYGIDALPVGHHIDHVFIHKDNMGLGPSINQALAHIDALKKWDGVDASPFTVYLQDDILFSAHWLERLAKMFIILEKQHSLGFATGIECVEHPVKRDLGNGMLLKDWLRGTCLLGRHEYWMSMFPIPRVDPETGKERGRPHNGLGSGVDWHFMRVHQNSVCKTGRTNLVIPGLLQHMGFSSSTWLARNMPESAKDIDIIEKHNVEELRKIISG